MSAGEALLPAPELLVGVGGVPVSRWTPGEPRGGVVLLAVGADAAATIGLHALLREGFVVCRPDLGWRAGGDPDAVADHEAIADAAAARDLLPDGLPRFVVGVGDGGLHARLAACALLGLAGAAALGGRVSHAGVDARHPIQPLDLLPGLSCPLQCHFDAEETTVVAGHVDELERRLAGLGRPAQVFRYPTGGEWRGAGATTAWGRVRSFLRHLGAGPR